jgi:hypothetical protein
MKQALWLAVCLVPACATVAPQAGSTYHWTEPFAPGAMAQGWIGLAEINVQDVDIDSSLGSYDSDDASVPVIGGAFLTPLAGDRVKLGLEGGLSIDWEGDIDALVAGGGGLYVSASSDLFLTDFFIGPYVDGWLTKRTRVYGAGGVLMQYGAIDSEWIDTTSGPVHVSEDGFGGGVYARTGIEFLISPRTLLGFGLRWVDSAIDFGEQIDEIDLEQYQYLVTVTQRM